MKDLELTLFECRFYENRRVFEPSLEDELRAKEDTDNGLY